MDLQEKILNEVADIKRMLQDLRRNESSQHAPRYLRIREVEKRTGFRPGYIYQLHAQGKIPSQKVGRSLRFREDLLEQWISAGGVTQYKKALETEACDTMILSQKKKQI